VTTKQRVGGRGVGAVRRRQEEPEWEGIPPLQPRAMDKGARVSHPVLRPKSDAHRMYAQDQVAIHTARM
jgi:hypothetical protein